jgi:hypothetical protein
VRLPASFYAAQSCATAEFDGIRTCFRNVPEEKVLARILHRQLASRPDFHEYSSVTAPTKP